MGNLTSLFHGSTEKKSLETEEIVDQIDYLKLDENTKSELINYIKSLKSKSINLPDDFNIKLKDVELENTELLPMAIEYYKKIVDICKDTKKPEGTVSKKRMYFVKPKFSVDVVKKSYDEVSKLPHVTLDTNLVNLKPTVKQMNNSSITSNEYDESFNNVLTKKDMIGITKKMLRDSPNYIKLRFINSFNEILNNLSKVEKLSIGKASYMYKANSQGSTNDINSFRQIVSIPNIVSQFHRILSLRLNDYIQSNNYLNTDIQKGGVSGQKYAIFEQFYKIKNVVKQANKSKKSCAILFLDISNAFGNINLENLYKVLEFYKVDNTFIEYIKQFYEHFEYYVDINNNKTDVFKWQGGLIQGCSLSPLLFVISLNYILTHIDNEYKEKYGYSINDTTKILLTAFVDDICVICDNMQSLQIVYDKLVVLLNMLGLPVNKKKCAVMTVNDNTKVTGDLDTMQKKNVVKYLGEYISNDGTCTESYVQFIKSLGRKLKSVDVSKNCDDKKRIELFNQIIMPWIQRKSLAMYDITTNQRLKIISIIKPYIEKWDKEAEINANIFSNVSSILNVSNDSIISNVKFEDEDFDQALETEIDIANYVLKDTTIKLDYNQINDDFQLDLDLDVELEQYEELLQ